MDNNQELLQKKESLLELLHYLDDNNIWDTAKHLITYIEKSSKLSIEFLDLISNLISEAINQTEDSLSKEKLEEASQLLNKMKQEEIDSNKQDELDADSLINEINNM